jgi:polysaccharide deacetylase family protein (PEP-CTERM system associated)
MSGPIVNAMTVDVEDYFQVSAFEGRIARADWERLPSRVEANTERVMQALAEHGVRGTFFVLGWIAERHPGLVRRIAAAGHEVASHGYAHVRVTRQSPEEFRADITRTRQILEDLTGAQVKGYRAASFSIGAGNLWAAEVIAETGHRYSSSIYPVHHDLYGMPEAPRFPFRHPCGLLEVPVTTVSVLGQNLPAGGGGYFRLLPYGLYRRCLERVNRREGRAGLFYFHPWEMDPEQPRQAGVSLRTRVRHYTNLGRMQGKLRRLLGDFRWGRMDEVFLNAQEQGKVSHGSLHGQAV